jgi:uncharacterized membrane protein
VIDALRGFAIVQMIGFHLVYVVTQLGWVHIDMNREPPWVVWRIAIVSQFLLLVGVGLVLRGEFKPAWSDFWSRWREVAGTALIVSFGSWLVLGPRAIYFGILHLVAVALIAARLLLPLGLLNLVLGAGVLLVGVTLADASFDVWPTAAIGFTTRAPITEDYVPFFPWAGLVLLGTGAGAFWRRRGFTLSAPFERLNASPPRLLVFLGSWPLIVYLAHVPILAGLVLAFGWLAQQTGLRG